MTQVPRADTQRSGAVGPLLHNRDFLLLASSYSVSLLGDALSGLALPLLVLALTDSPAQAGLVATLYRLPYPVLGLPIGALVDRWDRKKVMALSDLVRCATYGSVPLAYISGELGLTQLYVVALVGGTAEVLYDTADNAAFPRVVPPEHLTRAASLTEGASSAVDLIGPALGGVVIGLGGTVAAGAAIAYGLDSLSYAASVALLLLIRTPFQAERQEARRVSMRAEVAAGLRFLWSESRLRKLAALQSAFMLIGFPAGLALIVLARQELRADPATIGLVFSVGGLGSLMGAFSTGWIRARLRVGQVLLAAFGLEAAAMFWMAVADSTAWAMGAWMVYALMLPVYFTTVYSYRVTIIPDELQGRVNSIFRLLTMGGGAAGSAVGGLILGQLGARPTLLLIGLGLCLCALAVSSTELRRV
jgi:MFS family permease